jgi:hypothetical protein
MGQQTRRRLLRELSKAAETAVMKRQVFGRLSLNRWLKILRELARYDEAGDLLCARTRKRAIASGVVLFLALFAVPMAAANDLGALAAAFACLALIAAGLLVAFLVRNRRLRNLDLANDFRNVLIPFLIALREDIPSGRKVRLKLDLAGPSEAKVIRKGDLAPRGERKLHETVYSDPWCQLEAPLSSGNSISLDIANTYTRQDIRYRTSRGKRKHKSKWKKLVVVRAEIIPDAKRFALDPSSPKGASGPGDVRLKKRLEGESAMIKTKWKVKSRGPSPPPDSIPPKAVVAMFLRLGSMLRPLPTGSQPS